MRRYLTIAVLFSASINASSQISLPPLENINPKDGLSFSFYRNYIDTFAFAIFLKPFSNWGADNTIGLAYNKNGWYKLQINTKTFSLDTPKNKVSVISLEKDNGDSLFKILQENHLFDMQDERAKKLPCKPKADTILRKRKMQIVEEHFIIDDGPEYEFEIINRVQSKRLYFYAPEEYYNFCPDAIERRWIINCIKAFEKYLGR